MGSVQRSFASADECIIRVLRAAFWEASHRCSPRGLQAFDVWLRHEFLFVKTGGGLDGM
jgi:hypothetical protein